MQSWDLFEETVILFSM